jgi:Rrf2 family nitric oxide-sensitive transcriptional repressor
MRLTEHTDYALRLLMYLGANRHRLATTSEVAALHGISRHHLIKVVNELARAGFIATVRGRAGGIRLSRPPSDIMIGDVIRHTERDFHVVACLSDRPKTTCALAPTCVLKGVLCYATSCFLEPLDRTPLSNLLQPTKEQA